MNAAAALAGSGLPAGEFGTLRPGARIVVAMSGGVDSSVVAGLAAAAGYEAIGVTLQLYDHGAATGRKGACCAGQDIHDARRVADHLGIAHYVLDMEARFRAAVIEDFAATYAAGQTPIPCVRCNQSVKFTDLLAVARDLGAEALATGHYVRRAETAGGARLLRAIEPARDQSYFLFATTRDQLDFCRFPLGAMTKAETRAIAERLGLPVAVKPDSQDICFVPHGHYADLVRKLRPEAEGAQPGEIVHRDGRVLGRHAGVIHYTVGQHRGLGPAATDGGEPMFVLALDPARRRVVVGPRAALGRQALLLDQVNWLVDPPAPGMSMRVAAKLRSREAAAPAAVAWDGAAGLAHLVLDAPAVVAPGQAGVFYEGETVLGGGFIRREPAGALDAGAVAAPGRIDAPAA